MICIAIALELILVYFLYGTLDGQVLDRNPFSQPLHHFVKALFLHPVGTLLKLLDLTDPGYQLAGQYEVCDDILLLELKVHSHEIVLDEVKVKPGYQEIVDLPLILGMDKAPPSEKGRNRRGPGQPEVNGPFGIYLLFDGEFRIPDHRANEAAQVRISEYGEGSIFKGKNRVEVFTMDLILDVADNVHNQSFLGTFKFTQKSRKMGI